MKVKLHFVNNESAITNIGDNLHGEGNPDIFALLQKCIETNGPVQILNEDGTQVLYEREFKDLKSIEIILKD